MTPRMTQPPNSLACSCKKCDSRWTARFQLPMEMGKWLKELGKLKCPTCGAKHRDVAIHFD